MGSCYGNLVWWKRTQCNVMTSALMALWYEPCSPQEHRVLQVPSHFTEEGRRGRVSNRVSQGWSGA